MFLQSSRNLVLLGLVVNRNCTLHLWYKALMYLIFAQISIKRAASSPLQLPDLLLRVPLCSGPLKLCMHMRVSSWERLYMWYALLMSPIKSSGSSPQDKKEGCLVFNSSTTSLHKPFNSAASRTHFSGQQQERSFPRFTERHATAINGSLES